MRPALALVVVLAAFALAACGGDDDDTPAAPTTVATTGNQPDASPGDTLERFLRAAGDGDAERMWLELDSSTQRRWGPTLEDFRGSLALDLAEGAGSFARADAELIVDEQLTDELGVAAVAGEREAEGVREFSAYAAAATVEAGSWKLVLGGEPTITPLRPEPTRTVRDPERASARVEPAASVVESHVWLGNRALEAALSGDELNATLPELPPGEQVLIAFAATDEAPNAVAWTFTTTG